MTDDEDIPHTREAIRASLEKATTDLEEVTKFMRHEAENFQQLADLWNQRMEKEKKPEKKWLMSLTGMNLAVDAYVLNSNADTAEQVMNTSILSIKNSLDIVELTEKIPDMEKVRDETLKRVDEEMMGLQKVIEDAKKRAEEKRPPPPPEGFFK